MGFLWQNFETAMSSCDGEKLFIPGRRIRMASLVCHDKNQMKYREYRDIPFDIVDSLILKVKFLGEFILHVTVSTFHHLLA